MRNASVGARTTKIRRAPAPWTAPTRWALEGFLVGGVRRRRSRRRWEVMALLLGPSDRESGLAGARPDSTTLITRRTQARRHDTPDPAGANWSCARWLLRKFRRIGRTNSVGNMRCAGDISLGFPLASNIHGHVLTLIIACRIAQHMSLNGVTSIVTSILNTRHVSRHRCRRAWRNEGGGGRLAADPPARHFLARPDSTTQITRRTQARRHDTPDPAGANWSCARWLLRKFRRIGRTNSVGNMRCAGDISLGFPLASNIHGHVLTLIIACRIAQHMSLNGVTSIVTSILNTRHVSRHRCRRAWRNEGGGGRLAADPPARHFLEVIIGIRFMDSITTIISSQIRSNRFARGPLDADRSSMTTQRALRYHHECHGARVRREQRFEIRLQEAALPGRPRKLPMSPLP